MGRALAERGFDMLLAELRKREPSKQLLDPFPQKVYAVVAIVILRGVSTMDLALGFIRHEKDIVR